MTTTNKIGGKVKHLPWLGMLTLADREIHRRLVDMCAQDHVAGLVCFENHTLDSSQLGHRTFLIYGPGCSLKTLDECASHRLGDVPSRFQYPVACWVKGEDMSEGDRS